MSSTKGFLFAFRPPDLHEWKRLIVFLFIGRLDNPFMLSRHITYTGHYTTDHQQFSYFNSINTYPLIPPKTLDVNNHLFIYIRN